MKSDVLQILNFPEAPEHLVSKKDGQTMIRCLVRKRDLVFTPEEWVRQSMIYFLVEKLGYPLGLISVEKSLKVNGLPKRWDIVVYAQTAEIYFLIEVKAPNIALQQPQLEQLLRYQSVLKAPYLCLSNGLQHAVLGCDDNGKMLTMKEFPSFLKTQ
jgi:hypothetical protein